MQTTRFKTLAFSVLALSASGAVLLSTPARSQLGVAKNYVALQGATPGTAQSGHANISGTMRANGFVGSGAGLHSLSGDSISSGVVQGDFLPPTVAMENEVNTFTRPNFFNDNAFFGGFVRVQRASGQVSSTESFGIGESATDFDGMYVKTAQSGKPYYGYAPGQSLAYHMFNGANSEWSLVIGGSPSLRATAGGVGIGTAPSTSTDTRLKVVGRTRMEGNLSGVEGVLDLVNTGSGTGIQSIAYGNGAAGMLGRSGNAGGFGVYGDNTAFTSGVGVYGYGWGSVSTGVGARGGSFGLYAETNNGSGVAIYGISSTNYGVRGVSSTTHGVLGESTSAEAVVGVTQAVNKGAVHGFTNVASSHGAWFTSAATSGAGVGVIGSGASPTGFGVYSSGRTGASGTKSFRIDHPLDPENKFLSHYCTEGPEPLNVYSGTIVTGQDGYANVQLPNYFASINRDPRVQLTVDDESEDFVMAKVVGGVQANGFRLRTSKPGVKVYWEVKAVRNDAFVQEYGAPVETLKTDAERGRYQHPELYDAPANQGLFYRAKPDMPKVTPPTLRAMPTPAMERTANGKSATR